MRQRLCRAQFTGPTRHPEYCTGYTYFIFAMMPNIPIGAQLSERDARVTEFYCRLDGVKRYRENGWDEV